MKGPPIYQGKHGDKSMASKKKRYISGQTILEYATLTVCVIAALLTMNVYVKRGMQGRLRQVADELGSQYDPRSTESDEVITTLNSNVTTYVSTRQGADNRLETTTNITSVEEESRSGEERIGPMGTDLF